jgi:CDGSH-type Zn-finger protein
VANNVEIRVMKNGPYMVSGNIPLYPMTIKCSEKNIAVEWLIGERPDSREILACRCGKSQRKPCDGSHVS